MEKQAQNQKPQIIRLIRPQKILLEPDVSDTEDEEEMPCRLCKKSFANLIALRNHVRMMHVLEYEAGADPAKWYPDASTNSKFNTIGQADKNRHKQENSEDEQKKLTEKRTAELMMSLKPQSLMSLASEDVSYIIIKADPDCEVTKNRKRKSKEKDKDTSDPSAPKRNFIKRDKEPETITGPFECLEPSSHVADSTCHRIFFSCCEYSIHHRDEHSRRRRMPRCQVCEKPLAEGPGAEPAKPEAPFPCQVCGEGFDSNKLLQEHTSTAHVKLKPFQCELCLKRFTQQGGLQQHMRMHAGDRPYVCTFCPKAFTQKSGRDQHMRTHTKVKPYRCVVCNKTFCQPVHLKQHMRTHTNVAPFECGLCGKRFKQSSHLNYHLKSHNESEFTEEQKEKFAHLLYVIKRHSESNKDGYIKVKESSVKIEVEEIDETGENIMCIQNDDNEQLTLEAEETGYVVNEEGNETWCVKLVS